MSSNHQPRNIIGATITATATVLVGGCRDAQDILDRIDESIVADWYIGDGERAEEDDVVCKLVGPEGTLTGSAQLLLDALQNTSVSDESTAYFRIHFRID